MFFDNVNSDESIYKFLLSQQDSSKKSIVILAKKNSKFLFYKFNDYSSRIGKPLQLVRHTVISNDDYALTEFQNRNWSDFIKRILEVPQNGLELTNYSITDKSENKIITDTTQNFKIIKTYMSLYNTVGDDLLKICITAQLWNKNKLTKIWD